MKSDLIDSRSTSSSEGQSVALSLRAAVAALFDTGTAFGDRHTRRGLLDKKGSSDMSGVRGDCDGSGGQRMESEWREITVVMDSLGPLAVHHSDRADRIFGAREAEHKSGVLTFDALPAEQADRRDAG